MRGIVWVVFAWAACSRSSIGSSPESMRSWARSELQQRLPLWSVEDGDEALVLKLSRGEHHMEVWLGRPFEHCQTMPRECESTARDYIAGVVDAAAETAEPKLPQAAQLFPAIRSRDAVEAYKARAVGLLSRPIAGDLFLVYMLDAPKKASVVDQRALDTLQLAPEEAESRAFENLHAQLPALETLVSPSPDGSVGVVNPANYYTSSLLVPHASWSEVATRFDGKLLVAVPTPELLLFAHERDASTLGRIAERARKEYTASPQGLSHTVLRWSREGWMEAAPRP